MVNNSLLCLSKPFCVFVFFLNSASWGAIPSACFVRCTCALKYIYDNNIVSMEVYIRASDYLGQREGY